MTAEMVLRHEEELKPIVQTKETDSLSPKIKLPFTANTSIYNQNFQCVFSLTGQPSEPDQHLLSVINRDGFAKLNRNQFHVFGARHFTPKGNVYLSLSEEVADLSKLNKLRNILILCFVVTIFFVILSSWFFAGQSLRPVSHIVEDVDAILPAKLSTRLKDQGSDDELSHLVKTFNNLLERIDLAFNVQKKFIANVSHELKNPLAAIDTQLQFVNSKDRTQEEYQKAIESIHEDIKEMSQTMEKLLQLARVHSEGERIPMSLIQIDEHIYDCREYFLKNFPQYQVSLHFSDFPGDEKQLMITANAALLKIAFMNLMENACKFSPQHFVSVKVDLTHPESISIEFHNSGPSIPQHELDKIFEAFYRSSTQARKKGTGIGLHLVKSIVQLHQFDIQVNSSEKNGTSFTVVIPRAEFQSKEIINQEVNAIDPAPVKSSIGISLWTLLAFCFFFSCKNSETNDIGNDLARKALHTWYKEFKILDWNTDGYRPPVSARLYAYLGLGVWQCSLPVLDSSVGMHELFPEIKYKPYSGTKFSHAAAINACLHELAKQFFISANMNLLKQADVIYKKIQEDCYKYFPEDAVDLSDQYGLENAQFIYDYSKMDSTSHQSFLYNYDPRYHPPEGKGKWRPTGAHQMPALLPHWNRTRTFVVKPEEIKSNPPIEFSEDRNSRFFAEAFELCQLSQPLSDENRWIAEFWSDDFPGIALNPASRWLSILIQLEEKFPVSIQQMIELRLKIGLGLNDAVVKVWTDKYYYNVERPETYINRVISSSWQPLHDTPPFPAYPSGHSAFGACASSILQSYFGTKINFTDNTHKGRKEFIGTPRTFKDFQSMALENALSRLYIGAHFRMDCEEGLRQGYIVAEKVSQLKLYKSKP